MSDELKKIREHIERMVTHLAREYQTTDDKVWEQMLITSVKHTGAHNIKVIDNSISAITGPCIPRWPDLSGPAILKSENRRDGNKPSVWDKYYSDVKIHES